jgi:hypothetical protein
MAAAGIGSRVTFDSNVAHLCLVGLIEVRTIAGEHDGNEYTVYLPEEQNITMPSQTSQTSATSLTSHAHKVDRLVSLESSQTSQGSTLDDSITYEHPHTFLKTHDDDDETHTLLYEFLIPILDTAREILAGPIPTSEQERERWRECASILKEELRTAADRAGNISSVPAFFATHLRRRFAKNRQALGQQPQDQTPLTETKKASPVILEVQQSKSQPKVTQGSKFSLEQCRQYADYLHRTGQGINRPGGYATTIYRTGEVDVLIEKFLNPQVAEAQDSKWCLDCRGTGFIYPEGIERGVVAKCKHPRLGITIRLSEYIDQIRQLHTGDAGYQISDLIDDLRFRCDREGITWDDEIVNTLVNS